MKVASIQMISTPDVLTNLQTAQRLLREAAVEGADLAVLPEYFCLMGHKDTDKLAIAEQPGVGLIQDFLAEQASGLKLNIIAGTLPLQGSQPNRVFNACLVYNRQGQQVARYDKIHLFCFTTPQESYDEGRVLEAGTQPVAVEIEGFQVGLSVCYDLRFPELYRHLAPLDLIVVPAAFTHTTGLAHWELLLRARAVENQCYVLGCGQGGLHPNGRRTFGHSMVIDPWGSVLSCLPEGEGMVLATLSPDKITETRAKIPALTHRVL